MNKNTSAPGQAQEQDTGEMFSPPYHILQEMGRRTLAIKADWESLPDSARAMTSWGQYFDTAIQAFGPLSYTVGGQTIECVPALDSAQEVQP